MAKQIHNSTISKKYRLPVIILVIVAFMFAVVPFTVSGVVYEGIFGRCETPESEIKYLSDYDGLAVENVNYMSYQGILLAGYIYTNENVDNYDGVVILAHGLFGGGHISYLDVIDYFTSNGFIVFTYDATGNDASEGKSVRGIPQGVMDLDTAIHYVEDPNFGLNEYPLFLWGHSWGAYSVDTVLNYHPEVDAVVSCAGFNRSGDMLKYWGRSYVGDNVDFSIFYVNLYELIKFGKYSPATALKGFEKSDADIMIVHSADDTAVPTNYGYDLYYEEFGDDNRFLFRHYSDRGHNVYYSDAETKTLDETLFDEMAEMYRNAVDC